MRQIDKEYAEALFVLATEEGVCEEYLSDLRLIREVISEEPEYIDLLSSPAISLCERLSAIDEAFSGRVGEYTLYFLKLLCEKGRINIIFDVIEEFEKLYAALSQRCTAYVISAYELSEEQKAALTSKLEKATGKKIKPEYSIDESLMGGVKIELEGKIFDGTLRSRLRDVKDVMLDDATQRDQ